jgi:MFS family permease
MIMSVVFQNFVWGPISDKLQKRRTFIILGEFLGGIGTIVMWLIHFSIENLHAAGFIIIISLSCVEMFWSMSNIGWSALISDIYPFEKRSRTMGQFSSIGGIGRVIGIFIGGILYDNGFGFRNGALFFVASFVMFISILPMLLSPEGGVKKDEKEEFHIDKNNDHQKSLLIFSIFIVALILINFGRNSIAVPYSQYLTLDSGFNVDSITLSFIANSRSVSVIIIGLVAGFITKKLGHSNSLIFGTALAIIALIITATSIHLQLIFIGGFLFGAAEVIVFASSYTIASNLIPARMRGKLFAVYNTTFFLSWGSAGTLISGPLIDYLINQGKSDIFAYQVSFLIGALLCLIGVAIFIFLEISFKIKNKKNPF